MRYRFLTSFGKIEKGAIRDMPRTAMMEYARQQGVEPWTLFIPEELGASFTEKPEVVLTTFEDDKVPIPALESVDTDELQKDLQKSHSKRQKILSELSSMQRELETMIHRLSIIGCDSQEEADIEKKRRRIERLHIRLDEVEAEALVLQKQLERGSMDFEPENPHIPELKRLALVLAQFPGLLDQLDLKPSWHGNIIYQFGEEAHAAFTEFLILAADFTGESAETIGSRFNTRADLAQLVTWAKDTIGIDDNQEPEEVEQLVSDLVEV